MNNQMMTVGDKKELAQSNPEAWGYDDFDSNDIVIPRLLLMQGLSDFVAKGKATSGDFVNNVTGETIGGKDKSVELVLIDMFKNWVVTGKGPKDGKFKFEKVVAWKDGNPNWEFETKEGDKTVRRYQCLNFYVLKSDNIDGLPLMLTFRSTSYRAGKKVVTFATESKMMGKSLATKTIKLGATSQTNDLGTFYVFTVEPGRLATETELTKSKLWHDTIRNKEVKVADETVEDEVEPVTDPIKF